MNIRPKCACSGGSTLMFSCSGAADLAEIADRAVRTLHKAGEAKMYCLAGLGGSVEAIVNTTRAAGKLLAVDGCDIDCARKILERNGFQGFLHIRISDLGMEKGKTPVTPERIEMVAGKLRDLLNQREEAGPMKKLEVFDPPLCCSTGVCGPKVDPALVQFAADLRWLTAQGVAVERFNLAQQPQAFAGNETVKAALQQNGNECLPLVLLDGAVAVQGRYPSREELAGLTGANPAAPEPGGAKLPVVNSRCC